MAGKIITLTTDFGRADSYVGAMKGVILSLAPDAVVVDISHEIEPQNVRQGAFVLYSACPFFPPGTIHVAVVDPGVGSERWALAVRTEKAIFLAPDNGLLSYILAEELTGKILEAVHLTEGHYWLSRVSRTFHGRDIFAPVAAHLARGVPLSALGQPLADLFLFPFPRPRILNANTLLGHIIYIDRFGNLITSFRFEEGRIPTEEGAVEIPPSSRMVVELHGRRISGIKESYVAGQKGEFLALTGSSGHLEIAISGGNAAEALRAGPEDEVILKIKP